MIRFSHEANNGSGSWLIYCGGYVWEKITPQTARYFWDGGCDTLIIS